MLEQKKQIDQNLAQTCISADPSQLYPQISQPSQYEKPKYCANRFCLCRSKNKDQVLTNYRNRLGMELFPSNVYQIETTQSQCSDQFESLDSINNSIRQIDVNQQIIVVQEEYQIKTSVLPEGSDQNSQSSNQIKNLQTQHQSVTQSQNMFKKENIKFDHIKNKLTVIKVKVNQFKELFHKLQKDLEQFKLKVKIDYQNLKEALLRYFEVQILSNLKMQEKIFLQKQQFDNILKQEVSRESNKNCQKLTKMQLQIDILLQEIVRVKTAGEQSILAQKDKMKIISRQLQELKQRLIKNELQNDVLRKLIKEKERENDQKDLKIKKLRCKIQSEVKQKLEIQHHQRSLGKYSENKYNTKGREAGIMLRSSKPQDYQIKSEKNDNEQVFLNSHQLKQILQSLQVQVDGDQFFSKVNPEMKIATSKERSCSAQDKTRKKENDWCGKMQKLFEIVSIGNNKNSRYSDDSNIFKERLKIIKQFQSDNKKRIIEQIKAHHTQDRFRLLYNFKKYEKCSKMTQIEQKIMKLKSQQSRPPSLIKN